MAVLAAREFAGAHQPSLNKNKSLTLGDLETQLDFDDDARFSVSLGSPSEVNSDDEGGCDDIAEGDSMHERHQGSNHVVDSNESDGTEYNEDDLLSEPLRCPCRPSKPLLEQTRPPFKRFVRPIAMVVGRRQGTNHSVVLNGSDCSECKQHDMFTEFPDTPRRPFKRRVIPTAAIVGHPASLLRYKRKMGDVPDEASAAIAA